MGNISSNGTVSSKCHIVLTRKGSRPSPEVNTLYDGFRRPENNAVRARREGKRPSTIETAGPGVSSLAIDCMFSIKLLVGAGKIYGKKSEIC